jgi:lipopolysaccharide export system protein LptC
VVDGLAAQITAQSLCPVAHRRYFSLSRDRPRAGPSRLVAFMKLLLPATALAIVGLTFAWPQLLPDQNKIRIGDTTMSSVNVDDLVMDNPRFFGTDSENRPYRIAAASASQHSKSDQLIYLEDPKADLLMDNSRWVAMAAQAGVYDKTSELVDLSGGVTLFYDRGYLFVSETAQVNLQDGTAMGNRPVSGHGEGGQIEAEGFRLYDRGTRIVFAGRSKAVLRSAKSNP